MHAQRTKPALEQELRENEDTDFGAAYIDVDDHTASIVVYQRLQNDADDLANWIVALLQTQERMTAMATRVNEPHAAGNSGGGGGAP